MVRGKEGRTKGGNRCLRNSGGKEEKGWKRERETAFLSSTFLHHPPPELPSHFFAMAAVSSSFFQARLSLSPPRVVVTRERGKNAKLVTALVGVSLSLYIRVSLLFFWEFFLMQFLLFSRSFWYVLVNFFFGRFANVVVVGHVIMS